MDEGYVASVALMIMFAGMAIFWMFVGWVGYRIVRLFFKGLKEAENRYK